MATITLGPGPLNANTLINAISSATSEQILVATSTTWWDRAGSIDLIVRGQNLVFDADQQPTGGTLTDFEFYISGTSYMQYHNLVDVTVNDLILAFERGGTPEALAAVLNRGNDHIVVS